MLLAVEDAVSQPGYLALGGQEHRSCSEPLRVLDHHAQQEYGMSPEWCVGLTQHGSYLRPPHN
jgi:hypothetical protein